MQELYDTEQAYVEDLRSIVDVSHKLVVYLNSLCVIVLWM